MNTFYDDLEVNKNASKEVIEKAYKTLAKKYHPDIQQSQQDKSIAEIKMKKINVAYDTLGDDSKKEIYDKQLQEQENEEKYKVAQESNSIKNNQTYETNNVSNYYQNQKTEIKSDKDKVANSNFSSTWQSMYAKLNPREQKKVRNKIIRNANEEYRKQYEDYFRSLGYKVPQKWTLKRVLGILEAIGIMIIILIILWIIPPTRNLMKNFYDNNVFIKTLVNVVSTFVSVIWQTICKTLNIG